MALVERSNNWKYICSSSLAIIIVNIPLITNVYWEIPSRTEYWYKNLQHTFSSVLSEVKRNSVIHVVHVIAAVTLTDTKTHF